jgi:hypothetical protein
MKRSGGMAIAAILTVLAAVLWAGYLYVYNFTKSRYQGWLRAAITLNFLSLAAWLLWLPNGGWWNLSLVLAWIVMFPTVFILDDLRELKSTQKAVTLRRRGQFTSLAPTTEQN